MKYYIDKIPKKVDENLLFSIIDFCVQDLNINLNELYIFFGGVPKEFYAYTDYDEELNDGYIHIRKNIPLNELKKTLFHEMMHIKQYEQKKFRITDKCILWENNDIINMYDQESPWELESFEYEKTSNRIKEDFI